MTLFGYWTRNFLSKIDNNISKLGLNRGILKTADLYGIRLSVSFENGKTKNILEKDGAVVVCNHPSFIDPFVLLCSIPQRKNVFILLSSDFIGLSREIDKIAIPVYIRNKTKNNKIVDRIFEKLVFNQPLDYEEAHRRNINSVNKAAKKVSQGSIVIVFPSPFADMRKNKWKVGIGHLLKNIPDGQNKYYVEAFIGNTTMFDLFRLLPFTKMLFPKIEVRFKEPKRISAVIRYDQNEKQIVEKLQSHYLDS